MAPASERVGELDCLVHAAPGAASGAFVLLHGYSMEPEDLAPLALATGLPLSFYFPRGPERAASGGHCWWPVDEHRRDEQMAAGPRDLRDEHPVGRAGSRRQLITLLAAVAERHPGRPLILGGFSQGGMLCADALLVGRAAVDALVLLSTCRIATDEWLPHVAAMRGLPVLICHGVHDPNLSLQAGEGLRGLFEGGGAAVQWHAFDGGHETPLSVWRIVRRFLASRLAC